MTTLAIKKKITPIFRRRDVIKAAIFGSFARGEEKKSSDVDVLVEFQGKKSLLDLVKLQFELEDKLNRKVDLLTYNSIHPLLRDIVLKEQKVIYEKKS